MEASALNLAHEKHRRAEAFLREGRFEEAAKCHEAVADLLSEAHAQLQLNFGTLRNSSMTCGDTPPLIASVHTLVSLESLALQRDYHNRQAAVVRMKKAQYEEYKVTLESQQRDYLAKQMPKQSDTQDSIEFPSEKLDNSLRQAIYRTIDEQDSLLSLILLPLGDEKPFKHPKDPITVIEELKTVNCQLRNLIGNLLHQLEAKDEEIRKLSERLRVVSISPDDSTRLQDERTLHHDPLPSLAPLEMPLFDFTSS